MDSETVAVVMAMLAFFSLCVSFGALYFSVRSSKASESSANHAGTSARAAESSANSANRSADAAERQVRISATELAASAPFFNVEWEAGGWSAVNVKDATAHNLEAHVDPFGCSVYPTTRTASRGELIRIKPKVPMPNLTLTLRWTRTPEGGPDDEPMQETFKRPRLDGR
ncbi:hypothetical protein ACWIDS_15885 [Dietzia maris]